jgi:uncharacterized protein (DUF849 family)
VLQAALNGDRTRDEHPALPHTADELAADAAACVSAGAGAIHMHPRDGDGAETLEPRAVDAAVVEVRDACGVPVGVSTGEWIEPDLERRLRLVAGWSAPDYASVNLSEAACERVMDALAGAGVGIEAGVGSVEDAERLAASGFGDRVTRILVEPFDPGAARAIGVADEIHAALDRLGLSAPRLEHSDGEATWVLIEDAARRGLDTRVGLEDTLVGPDGSRARGNAALVTLAASLHPTLM